MTHRVQRKKWILYRHTQSFDLIKRVALELKFFSKSALSKNDKSELLLKLKRLDFYKERNPNLPLDAINHRINTLAYYMFGYKESFGDNAKFLFSPLGNLFIKYSEDETKLSKIFFTMLWGVQFEHPNGGSDKVFNIYPFRLLFKLLTDSRLSYKLFAFEVEFLLVFVEKVDQAGYEKLVSQILNVRKWNNDKIEEAFNKDVHTYVNAAYEWDYYVSEFFQKAGILEKIDGETIFRLKQGKNTYRKVTRNSVILKKELLEYCSKLMEEYPYDEVPIRLDDPERLKKDVIKEIYNFYPRILLEEIGEESQDIKFELLNLTKLIDKYSNNNDGEEAYLFEDILTDGFNMFINVEAVKVGGPGNTDIECLFLSKNTKFVVDAKSTKNKLSSLNAGRLAGHREKIGGQYTIVITPRYVPAVLMDIKNVPIVIIRASTFSEYLYNHIQNEIREIDYSDLDSLITSNLGTDISTHLSELTINKFAVRN